MTEQCQGQITSKDIDGEGRAEMQVVVGMGGVGGQSVLSTHHDREDGEEIEDVLLLFPYPPILTNSF